MSMQDERDERVWVIKNSEGYYVNPKFKALFSGLCSGFIFYDKDKEETIQKDLDMLGVGYHSEQVNLNEVADGVRVYID